MAARSIERFVCMGVKTPGFNERLPSSWLDAVLDLTGSVDGEKADEGGQRLGNVLDYGGAQGCVPYSVACTKI